MVLGPGDVAQLIEYLHCREHLSWIPQHSQDLKQNEGFQGHLELDR